MSCKLSWFWKRYFTCPSNHHKWSKFWAAVISKRVFLFQSGCRQRVLPSIYLPNEVAFDHAYITAFFTSSKGRPPSIAKYGCSIGITIRKTSEEVTLECNYCIFIYKDFWTYYGYSLHTIVCLKHIYRIQLCVRMSCDLGCRETASWGRNCTTLYKKVHRDFFTHSYLRKMLRPTFCVLKLIWLLVSKNNIVLKVLFNTYGGQTIISFVLVDKLLANYHHQVL